MVSIYWLRILLLGGLRRFEIGKHVVFYVLLSNGIKIVRVLHQQMIPAKSLLDR
jgi:plasmid stabilization system protein ParE